MFANSPDKIVILTGEENTGPNFERAQAPEERFLRFASSVMDFAAAFARAPEANPLVSQLVRSATSIVTNCAEANASETTADFVQKCSIPRREAAETRYGIKTTAFRARGARSSTAALLLEREPSVRIFGTIVSRSNCSNS